MNGKVRHIVRVGVNYVLVLLLLHQFCKEKCHSQWWCSSWQLLLFQDIEIDQPKLLFFNIFFFSFSFLSLVGYRGRRAPPQNGSAPAKSPLFHPEEEEQGQGGRRRCCRCCCRRYSSGRSTGQQQQQLRRRQGTRRKAQRVEARRDLGSLRNMQLLC